MIAATRAVKRKQVDKAAFDKFIANYPRPLACDVAGMFEPPLLTYNDFTLGNWPDSSVAAVVLNESYPKDGKEPYKWSPNAYSILNEESKA